MITQLKTVSFLQILLTCAAISLKPQKKHRKTEVVLKEEALSEPSEDCRAGMPADFDLKIWTPPTWGGPNYLATACFPGPWRFDCVETSEYYGTAQGDPNCCNGLRMYHWGVHSRRQLAWSGSLGTCSICYEDNSATNYGFSQRYGTNWCLASQDDLAENHQLAGRPACNHPSLFLLGGRPERKAVTGYSAWSQGGGGCHSVLSQQGYIRGFRFAQMSEGQANENHKPPLLHTTASGGGWMWTAMLSFQATNNLTSLADLYGMSDVGWLANVVNPNGGAGDWANNLAVSQGAANNQANFQLAMGMTYGTATWTSTGGWSIVTNKKAASTAGKWCATASTVDCRCDLFYEDEDARDPSAFQIEAAITPEDIEQWCTEDQVLASGTYSMLIGCPVSQFNLLDYQVNQIFTSNNYIGSEINWVTDSDGNIPQFNPDALQSNPQMDETFDQLCYGPSIDKCVTNPGLLEVPECVENGNCDTGFSLLEADEDEATGEDEAAAESEDASEGKWGYRRRWSYRRRRRRRWWYDYRRRRTTTTTTKKKLPKDNEIKTIRKRLARRMSWRKHREPTKTTRMKLTEKQFLRSFGDERGGKIFGNVRTKKKQRQQLEKEEQRDSSAKIKKAENLKKQLEKAEQLSRRRTIKTLESRRRSFNMGSRRRSAPVEKTQEKAPAPAPYSARRRRAGVDEQSRNKKEDIVTEKKSHSYGMKKLDSIGKSVSSKWRTRYRKKNHFQHAIKSFKETKGPTEGTDTPGTDTWNTEGRTNCGAWTTEDYQYELVQGYEYGNECWQVLDGSNCEGFEAGQCMQYTVDGISLSYNSDGTVTVINDWGALECHDDVGILLHTNVWDPSNTLRNYLMATRTSDGGQIDIPSQVWDDNSAFYAGNIPYQYDNLSPDRSEGGADSQTRENLYCGVKMMLMPSDLECMKTPGTEVEGWEWGDWGDNTDMTWWDFMAWKQEMEANPPSALLPPGFQPGDPFVMDSDWLNELVHCVLQIEVPQKYQQQFEVNRSCTHDFFFAREWFQTELRFLFGSDYKVQFTHGSSHGTNNRVPGTWHFEFIDGIAAVLGAQTFGENSEYTVSHDGGGTGGTDEWQNNLYAPIIEGDDMQIHLILLWKKPATTSGWTADTGIPEADWDYGGYGQWNNYNGPFDLYLAQQARNGGRADMCVTDRLPTIPEYVWSYDRWNRWYCMRILGKLGYENTLADCPAFEAHLPGQFMQTNQGGNCHQGADCVHPMYGGRSGGGRESSCAMATPLWEIWSWYVGPPTNWDPGWIAGNQEHCTVAWDQSSSFIEKAGASAKRQTRWNDELWDSLKQNIPTVEDLLPDLEDVEKVISPLEHHFGPASVCIEGQSNVPAFSWKDTVWSRFLAPNGLPRNASFKFFSETSSAERWFISTATFTRAEGDWAPSGMLVTASKGHLGSGMKTWSDLSVVDAIAASSDLITAYMTWMEVTFKNRDCPGNLPNAMGAFLSQARQNWELNVERWSRPMPASLEGLLHPLETLIPDITSMSQISDDAKACAESDHCVVDAGAADNQGFLFLLKEVLNTQLHTSVISVESSINSNVMCADVYPTILMQGRANIMKSFWWAATYSCAQVPRMFDRRQADEIVQLCPDEWLSAMMENDLFALEVGGTGHDTGGTWQAYGAVLNRQEDRNGVLEQDTDAGTCGEGKCNPGPPKPGCENMWSRLLSVGMLYFEFVYVKINAYFHLSQTWTMCALALAAMMPSDLSRDWLNFSGINTLESFPSYPSTSYMELPYWSAYYLHNYMTHLSYVQLCCLRSGMCQLTGAAGEQTVVCSKPEHCPFCVDNENLCPCTRISTHGLIVNYLFPVMS